MNGNIRGEPVDSPGVRLKIGAPFCGQLSVAKRNLLLRLCQNATFTDNGLIGGVDQVENQGEAWH